MFTRPKEWFDDEKNIARWGFLYAEFADDRKWFSAVVLFREYATGILLGIAREPYTQLSLLIVTCLVYAISLWFLTPFKIGYYQLIPEIIANLFLAIGKNFIIFPSNASY